jgi:hypothetical protein
MEKSASSWARVWRFRHTTRTWPPGFGRSWSRSRLPICSSASPRTPATFYGSTFISRPDAFELSPAELAELRDLWRRVWDHRDILIVTGSGSRFLLEPDMFDNVRSSEFLYGPSENAFREYGDILSRIRGHSRDKLGLMALGPTATVLASDLAKEGYQAIDLGHLPSCYNLVKSGNRPDKTGY